MRFFSLVDTKEPIKVQVRKTTGLILLKLHFSSLDYRSFLSKVFILKRASLSNFSSSPFEKISLDCCSNVVFLGINQSFQWAVFFA